MTPRRRNNRKAGWPSNLYESRGYYTYRNKDTGEVFGLGRDRAFAFNQAIEANLYLASQQRTERLVDRIAGLAGHTVADWNLKYNDVLAERPLAKNTRKAYRNLSKRMVAMLGANTKIRAVTPLQISDGLDALAKTGRARTARVLRGFLHDSFAAAVSKGWRDDNPVRETKSPPVKIKRARLTFEVFSQVYTNSSGWLRNAIALALVTAQRRGDIAAAQFKDIRDGLWWVDQGKTGARICLPVELRLDCFGMSLGDVVRQCRATGVLSPHLIHQTVRMGGRSSPGKPIDIDTISGRFTKELAALNLTFEGKTPPTFHEIRSLAARLYKDQGNVSRQELLGHKSADTTLIYEDGRGEWIKVKVGTV